MLSGLVGVVGVVSVEGVVGVVFGDVGVVSVGGVVSVVGLVWFSVPGEEGVRPPGVDVPDGAACAKLEMERVSTDAEVRAVPGVGTEGAAKSREARSSTGLAAA